MEANILMKSHTGIGIGSDHAGFALKVVIKEHLQNLGYTVIDFGCDSLASCDYPLYAKQVGLAVQAGKIGAGILVCGTGIGMAITANKIAGVRAANCCDTYSARTAKEHNHANVLTLGARVVGRGLALDIVDAFLTAEYSQDKRHLRRVQMME